MTHLCLPSFSELAIAWLKDRTEQHQAGELADNTYALYERIIRLILIPELGSLRLDQISKSEIRLVHGRNQHRPAAANFALGITRRIYEEARDSGIPLPHGNPARGIRPHAELGSSRPLDVGAVFAVFSACAEVRAGRSDVCHATLAALYQLIAVTGCRPAELRRLRWEEVDLLYGEYGVLWLTAHKTKRAIGRKQVVLGPLARGILLSLNPERPEHPEWVFPSHVRPGKPYREIHRSWGRLADEAKVGRACLRDLRSGTATNAYAQGVPLELIREMLCHKSISTTVGYTKIPPARVGKAFAQLDLAILNGRSRKRGPRA